MARNKRSKIIMGTAVVLMIVALIATIVIDQIIKRNRENVGLSSELARAKTYNRVEEGEEAVEGTENVKFDAFFLRDLEGDGYAESIRGTCKEIGKEDTLYMEINVQTAGYLKDAKITVDGKNFYLQTALPKDEQLANNCIGSNIKEIQFNDLSSGTQKLLTGIVKSGNYTYTTTKANAIGDNINNYSREDNKIILTGTYVGEDGTETPIIKEVPFAIDWYGTTRARIYSTTQNKNIDYCINEEEGTINLGFSIYTEETDKKLILKSNHVEGEIPDLNGYEPLSVVCTWEKEIFNYDEATRKFTIDRKAIIEEDGKVIESVSDENCYGIKVIYPLEAYQSIGERESIQLKIPVKTYYEGYNNPNEEFINPYKSIETKTTIVANYERPRGNIARCYIEVGKYRFSRGRHFISKEKPLKIYNGLSEEEKDDTYEVNWEISVSEGANNKRITMKETENGEEQVTDKFIKTNGQMESVEDIVSNVGIYFSKEHSKCRADEILGDEGWIKIYDEDTDNLLVTFTQSNWNEYTSSNPYKYELPVKHIRIETSEVVGSGILEIYNIKEIDDEEMTMKYEKEEFDELQYISSKLVGYLGEEHINTTIGQAYYENPLLEATIYMDKKEISTQVTKKEACLYISARGSEDCNISYWKDGEFLIKFPEEIIDIQINSVTINNSNVKIENYELIEQDGQIFIKIITKNIKPQSYTITVNVDISADPRIATTTKKIELYATNENIGEYTYKSKDIYDVNNNLNTEENVNYYTSSISMISPNSLLTSQEASNYDANKSTVISPKIAELTPVYVVENQEQQEERTAQIGVQIRNNYTSPTSEIQILGKIPFKGNTYVISGKELGSTFTTKMLNTGIELPEELRGIAQVYYSENENPTKDISNEKNNWKLADQVENWDNIKTFLIDLGDYIMANGVGVTFNYTIKIPNDLEVGQVAYSHHGVYFCLDTENGKYETKTEPNKLGFKIAEKYDLELQKYQKGKEKLVPGATYSITEIIQNEDGTEENGKTRTVVTNNEGIAKLENLYVKKVYEIKEIKTPDNYELNTDVIRFISDVDKYGTLTVEKMQGEIKEDMAVTKEEGENYKVAVKVEDEIKTILKITKKEKDTENTIVGVRYKITGYNLPQNGETFTTNRKGEITIKGLSIGQEYTLTEVKAPEGYYVNEETIIFKIVNEDGNYKIKVMKGTIKESNITEEDSIPTISITLEDEKIPTYNLEITKVKRTTNMNTSNEEIEEEVTYLAGAKFSLYKENKEIGKYITGENGKVVINNLYQYVENKDENATYTLKEVLAPEGYVKVKDITFKVQENEGLKFINMDNKESKYTIEGNTVKLTIEDSPSFKLIKKDIETGEVLPNIKFAIYNIDEGQKPATNGKGEILGTKEKINGKEYYTIATDNNGEIVVDLTEGLYKAVEVQAPDKYDISKSTYYFGIGTSRENKKVLAAEWGKAVGGSNSDYINCITETRDGGYIIGGYFYSSSVDLGNGVVINNHYNGFRYYNDGMVIKYDEAGEVEWGKAVGGDDRDEITCIIETEDGGYLVGGCFQSSRIYLGNGVVLNNNNTNSINDGMLVKYSASGEVEWGKTVGGDGGDEITCIIETEDGGYAVGGTFGSSIDLGNGVNIGPGGILIKYSENGEVEWEKIIKTDGGTERKITCIIETRDGGYLVSGWFQSKNIDLGNGVVLNNNSNIMMNNSYRDEGMLIKYSASGEVEWGKTVGGSEFDQITCMTGTRDGGYLVGGVFNSRSIDLGNGVVLSNKGNTDGMLIKYSASGEVEWEKAVGGSEFDKIKCMAETRDGGYLIGGYFNSSSVDLGNGVVLNRIDSTDGMIIKYSESGEVEWGKAVGGNDSDQITCIVETRDGGYAVGGYFKSERIELENGTVLNSKDNDTSYSDGMLIKYKTIDIPEINIKQRKQIGGSNAEEIACIVETRDGGYLVGGYFNSSSVDLGNGVVLNRIGSTDGMIIKYDTNGEVEWGKAVGGNDSDQITCIVETRDGGYAVGGYFNSSSVDLGNGAVLNNIAHNDGMIIKYDTNGEVEWGKAVGGNAYDEITCIIETEEGGYLVGGYFNSNSVDLGNGVVLNSKDNNTNYSDGVIIKYDEAGNIEWGKVVGGNNNDQITCIVETRDGGYLVGGYFNSSSVELGNGVVLSNKGSTDGILIKYDKEGKVEWGKVVGENAEEKITCIVETRDGGYVVGGYFNSSSVDLENGVVLSNKGNTDGMLIKYDEAGEVEWGKAVGENAYDKITYIIETEDGGYLVGGYFGNGNLYLENGVVLSGKSATNGMLIKYDATGKAEWGEEIGESNQSYQINCIIETRKGEYLVGGLFVWKIVSSGGIQTGQIVDGIILKVMSEMGVPEVQELTIENKRKEFKVTTEVKVIEGVKGGNILGEGQLPYEIVKYGDNSLKEIITTPEENYEIISITVNGEEYQFTANEDGTYQMPQFENVTENKHVVVTFALKDNKITINKVDSNTKLPLKGAKFKINQIDERVEPENAIGEIVANGQTYIETDEKNEITGVLGELTNNGTYYFIEQEGKYIPTNGKTYQIANGGTAGKGGKTANSYIKIDLTGKEGKYKVVVNAEVSSESRYDYGYATITETTTAPAYSSTTGQFIYISGTQAATDYTSAVLEGGKTYYLHLGYRKDGSGDTGKDQIVFNSIKVCRTESKIYSFINTEVKYESNNQGKDNTVANSYIPIDLRGYSGKYNVIVNAEVSSENADYGYATITENTTRPEYNSSTGRFIYISGTQAATDYTRILEGGKQYYLHLGYYKNASISMGEDKFIVNNIQVTLNDSELYHTEVGTNSQGQVVTQIPFGKYRITEIEAPQGYNKVEEPIIIEFKPDEEHEYTIENEKKAKVTVRHYKAIKNEDGSYIYTQEEVAESEILEGKQEEIYTTKPHLDLGKYELQKDENGEYAIPENAVGKFGAEEIEVIYYYEERLIPVIVHHYIEGTEERIKIDGVEVEDEKLIGRIDETFETTPYKNLPEYYEYVSSSEITSGKYIDGEQEVIYYYRLKEYNYRIEYYYNDQKDEEATEEGKEEYGKEILGYEDKPKEGYKFKKEENVPLVISENEESNVIKIYYVTEDMSYTVKYLEEDTEEELHEEKVVENQEYGTTITTSSEIIEIEGYEYSSADKEKLTIGVDETQNVITIYYIKRSDLKYTVNYLEKETKEELHEPKVVNNQVYGGIITSSTEVIEIPGYNYDSIDKERITIQVDETQNVINIYYTIRTDIKYKVEYYYNGIQDEEETEEYEATYKDIIEEYEDKIRENYILVEVEGMPLTIEAEEEKNVIKVYYAKETTARVKYIDKTTNEILEEITEKGYVGKEFVTEAKDFEDYVLVEEPEEKTVLMEEDEVVLKYYYVHVSSGVIEKHIDIDTDEILYNTTHEGNEGDEYKTKAKEFKGYSLVEEKYPENAEGKMKREVITVNYYYKKKEEAKVTIKYIDKETKEEIEEKIIIEGYEGDEYKTEQKEIEGYEFIEVEGEQEGVMTGEKEVIYYYQKIVEPEIPGEGGAGDEEKPKDPTAIDKEIPSAGLTKEQIAIIVVTTMLVITGIIVTIGIKGIKLDKKH